MTFPLHNPLLLLRTNVYCEVRTHFVLQINEQRADSYNTSAKCYSEIKSHKH